MPSILPLIHRRISSWDSLRPLIDINPRILDQFRRSDCNPLDCLHILPDYLPITSQNTLQTLAESHIKRLTQPTYDEGHYDAVIKGYRECSVVSMTDHPIIAKTTGLISSAINASETSMAWLAPHILELREKNSHILAHIDNTSASGNVVGGLCLLADTTMVFKHKTADLSFTAFLPRGCLYYQCPRDTLRYDYEHSITEDQQFKGQAIAKGRRISIMLRNVNTNYLKRFK